MNTAIEQLSEFDFHQTLANTPGRALVFFTAPGCGACQHLRGVLRKMTAGPAIFEVDSQRDMGLAREFDVFHLPAMFLYHDGHFHCELQSEPESDKILLAIEQALMTAPTEAP